MVSMDNYYQLNLFLVLIEKFDKSQTSGPIVLN